jgi:hypothetical protein
VRADRKEGGAVVEPYRRPDLRLVVVGKHFPDA